MTMKNKNTFKSVGSLLFILVFNVTFSQSTISVPDFGILDQYVLFTSAGAIDYIGTPNIAIPGNLATGAGFITGFVDTVPSSRYYGDGNATRPGEVD